MLATNALSNANQLADAGQHLITSIRGLKPGPTLIVVGNLHGNEPAGVLAARRMSVDLQHKRSLLRGEVVLLAETRGR